MAQRVAQPSKPTDPMLGRVVAGRYRLEARLGEGGMGVVYRARHVLIDRVVALKLIRPDLRGETHLRAWMLREARAANRVDHAHIIDIHDIGETEEGELYLVMEYLVGTSLSSELARGPMPLARGVDILEQMCAALARAHDLGVVHRDLKSDNILLTTRGGRKDFVKILDFGLAAPRDGPAPRAEGRGLRHARVHVARAGARRRGAAAERSLRARRPLLRDAHRAAALPLDDRETLLEMQRTRRAPRPRSIKPDVLPAAESDRRCKLLEKDRRKRFQDAHHLHEELKALQRSLPSTPWEVAATGEQRARRRRRRRRSRAGVIEWASRAALFSRMVSRAYPPGNAPADVQSATSQAWDLAARATRLEGEVASHTRKLEALERRGRALRAEIGRKVEELAHEESRALRDAAAEQAEVARLERRSCSRRARRSARPSRRPTRRPRATTQLSASIFERAGAAAALVEAKREQLGEHETEGRARRTRRRAISAVRSKSSAAQLARYAEALEEDLVERPREGRRAHARGPHLREGLQRGLHAPAQPPQGQARGARPDAGAHLGDARPQLQRAEEREPHAELTSRPG